MSAATVIGEVSGLATAAGVFFAGIQLGLGRSQSRTTFEDSVATQYRELIKPQLSDALLGSLDSEQRAAVRPYYEYFDLCNEQVFLRMQGRIRRRTWGEWQAGIDANLDRPDVKRAWRLIETKTKDFEELRLLRRSAQRPDPRTWNPRWRRLLRRELSAGNSSVKLRASGQPEEIRMPPPPACR